MADLPASSPDLFASLDGGLDAFDMGDGALGDSSIVDSSGPAATSANAAASIVAETPISAADAGGRSGTLSNSPPDVTAPSQQQQQPDLFSPVTASQWAFQDTPPYESPISDGNSFGIAPQQTWDLPLNLGQLPQQSFYLQSTTAPAHDPTSASAPAVDNLPLASAFAPNLQPRQPEPLRTIENTLTPAQRERLKTIAMPPHLQYRSPQSGAGSPDSASSGHDKGSLSSPDGAGQSKGYGRKRKSSAEVDEDDDDDDLEQPVKRTAHNMIEKRAPGDEDTTEDREELHGLTPAHKLNKATILSKATEYIRHLEKRNNRLFEENNTMHERISAFEKLFMAGALTSGLPNPLQQPPTPIQYAQDAGNFLNTPMATPQSSDPPGMIPIPDNMKRILAAQHLNAGRPYPVPSAAICSWWVLLAGLMLVCVVLIDDTDDTGYTDARGLNFLVKQLGPFLRAPIFTVGGFDASIVVMLAKLNQLFFLGAFLWAAFSSFFDLSVFRPSKKSTSTAADVKAVPSLASPIHVRRQAWLTAIQTVWVPRHNFFLEAAALLVKTMKYTLRNVVGSHGYLALTGLSAEEETARVKAWSIALDAQLAGGDVEINKSRLTLTLIASGTLPDTPLRLMLKALHIRVLLWRLNGATWAANLIAAKLARMKWNEARQLNRILNSLPEGESSLDNALPEHLAALLEEDCDEVLSDVIIQRAHNLAWNQETTHNLVDKIDGMDTVVEDPAVRSPMDAVASWYSNATLHRVLFSSLQPHPEDPAAPGLADGIALAVRVAPIGSNAQVRALIARAVLADGKRGAHIVSALQALGPSANPDKHPDYRSGVPPLIDSPMTSIVPDPDAQMALRCAMGIAQLQKFEDPPAAAYLTIDSVLPAAAAVADLSLLGFTAAFHLMDRLNHHAVAREACAHSLERLAGNLRIWMGCDSAAGQKAGVDAALRADMIGRCLAVTKSVVGMEADPGYGSMDEECVADAEGGGC
ncbi:hypothetical protein CHGG_09013 [Chaetomium globosum CBS 148.51]|uniref:Sterol regulatory element-binding protein 1 C-terminal domain-containing protein n=1 Tax=Chaetomium globosum (strain ATCC 6205 / CBS 148.51 / DSM 1962 / NBRC 6347 / NRRL 1970) TaxID=306901 RepID=Q2GSP1_CHAGB|nr:uncharacterized protein CHGG_09013 [Chaetomium globosum CBS 148.51]EAQ84999.1 hypothetical protein CHGG_09013 [Chaetomium globosum CBS 148.51]